MKNKQDDRFAWVRQSGLLSTIPFLMAVPPIAGLLIGRYLDNRFNTYPVFTIVLLVFGFIASVREVRDVLRKANAGEKKKTEEKNKRG